MIIYHKSFAEARKERDNIDLIIEEKLKDTSVGSRIRNEGISWRETLTEMCFVLEEAAVDPSIHIAMEYVVPFTGNSRIDFIVSGYDDAGQKTAIIIEMKGWRSGNIEKTDLVDNVYERSYHRNVLHPSYQARSYVTYIKNFNSNVVDGKISLSSCAFLYNYRPSADGDVILDDFYSDCTFDTPVFFISTKSELIDFIKDRIKRPDNGETINSIESGKLVVSASLQESAIRALKEKDYFLPIDGQAEVFAKLLRGLKHACMKKEKKVFIVKGGPGTGKSVLALKLLASMIAEADLVTESKPTYYVTKAEAPRDVYSKDFEQLSKEESSKMLFTGGSSFIDKKELPVIIVDEAHRLVDTTVMKPGMKDGDRSQIREIINAAYGSVFFIDERQHVSIQDLGTISEIEKHSRNMGTVPEILELKAQFRCGGSSDYLDWLESMLQYDDSKDFEKIPDFSDTFEFRVFDDVSEMESAIMEQRQKGFDSRLVAGYCWPWYKKEPYGSKKEIFINENFDRKWNLPSGCWVLDSKYDDRVGCIHTVQGMEIDYVGVIIGDDMTCYDGKLFFDATKRDPGDRSVFGCKKMFKENPVEAHKVFDPIVRNTYRTLMTRGKKGCYVYATDKQLRDYIKRLFERTV